LSNCPQHSLVRRISASISSHGLFRKNDAIIVALSGGADSCALLHILLALGHPASKITACHLNHCLRGSESDADEQFCYELAASYGTTFESRRIDVKVLARSSRCCLEDAGRRARHAFLEEMRQKYHATAIALAHHADDQAETLLMRLIRGAGLSGLSAMSWRNGRLVRPMLDISRAEIEDYLQENRLQFREDSSNSDTVFLRNRIRHQLLPLLEEFNPAIRRGLAATAALLSDEEELLAAITAEQFSALAECQHGRVTFDIHTLAALPPAMQRRLIRLAAGHVAGNLLNLTQQHINDAAALIRPGRPNRRISLHGSLVTRRQYDQLIIEQEGDDAPPPACVQIDGPGLFSLWHGFLLEITRQPCPTLPQKKSNNTVWFDPQNTPFPWLVRPFQAGDIITPLGMNGKKKVKDIFIDAKIPPDQRRIIPLIFCDTQLIWIAGVRQSADSALDQDTRTALCVKIIKP